MTTDDIDLDRFPHESRRAIEGGGVLVDQLEPGSLRVTAHPGRVILTDADGRRLGSIPLYRLARADYSRLWTLMDRALDAVPVGARDQITAAVRDGRLTVHDDPAGEWVAVTVAGRRLAVVHRSHLVDGWPADEVDEPNPPR